MLSEKFIFQTYPPIGNEIFSVFSIMVYCNGKQGFCKGLSKNVYNFVLGCLRFQTFKLGFVGVKRC